VSRQSPNSLTSLKNRLSHHHSPTAPALGKSTNLIGGGIRSTCDHLDRGAFRNMLLTQIKDRKASLLLSWKK
jgi:hypothetical protein